LSYCWGDDRNFKTTRETVDVYHQNIPRLELPRTFQETFEVTRQLGIRYLWIDALCIVQDDELDWAKEVAHMHDVYAGSFLTIQAGEARSPLEGCFMPTCHGSAETKGSERTLFTTREASSNLEAIVHIIPHTARTSALNKRGWTLQETALSHRIVQLTNYELHWRCRSDMLWETGIQYADTERLYGNVPSIHGKHSQTWSRLWRTWIENYSGREFSFPNDRLPGIAGLVKACQWRISDECCLGLWRRSLHEDLAWCRIGTTSRSPAHPLMS
jgi:hypothetical protein